MKHKYRTIVKFRTILNFFRTGHFVLIFLSFISARKAAAQDYFQQEVNFEIQVTLDDQHHVLRGHETFQYINNSPDTLRVLYLHLWPNAYSNNETALAKQLFQLYGKQALFDNPELAGWIDSIDFKANNLEVRWNFLKHHEDICQVHLNEALKPGDTISISTPFRVKIPRGELSRFGSNGKSYQISQWYPKPAVYDTDGWHPMPYLDQGEFYSEFGTYEVSITLAEDYVVAATGELKTIEERQRLERLANKPIQFDTFASEDRGEPHGSTKLKTIQYTSKNVHDFAWFADPDFQLEKKTVILPGSGKAVTICVFYTKQQAQLWKNALPSVSEALLTFSEWIGDYPYPSLTVVQTTLKSGLGMEYPGFAVIGNTSDAYSLDEVITHEIGHNWFYSALASNERLHPYLDESLTSAYTARYMLEKYPDTKLWEIYIKNEKLAKFFSLDKQHAQEAEEYYWLSLARENLEQPINLSATELNETNYGLMLYYKGARGLNYLRAYLGDSLFDSAMNEYYRRWKFKHPQPDDFRLVMESYTEKDLRWFFEDFLGTTKRLDYEIERLEDLRLLVSNKGELASPLAISGLDEDSVYFEKWVEGFLGQQWIQLPAGNYTDIKIDPNHVMPEIFRKNNNIRTHGLFRKADPIQPQLYFSLEDQEKNNLMYFPSVSWTREDGVMLGLALNNGFVIPKRLEYFIMPFYGFERSKLVGYAKLSYSITPFQKRVRMATFSIEGSQFGAPGNQHFQTLKTGVALFFRSNPQKTFSQSIYGNYVQASNLSQLNREEKAEHNSFVQFGYHLKKQSRINPFYLHSSIEHSRFHQKITAELNYRLSYYGENRGLDFRLFSGAMLKESSDAPLYDLAPAGRNGSELYFYQGFYPDRFSPFPSTFWSRQMTMNEGGLVSPSNSILGYSNWLFSLTLTSSLPRKIEKLPIKPFLTVLLNEPRGKFQNKPTVFFEAGVKTGYWNLIEFYIPLFISNNIKSETGPFKDRIRLTFTLDSFKKINLNRRSGF